jgi:hypothetical protein
MADSDPAVYSASACPGLLATTARGIRSNTKLIALLSIWAGGLGVTALRGVDDRYGLSSALWISALMPLLAFATTRFLPAPRVHEAR